MAKRSDARSLKTDSDLQRRLGVFVGISRHILGIKQEELAWRANMHRTYVADIERGARNVTLRTLANLAVALKMSVENLVTGAAAPSVRFEQGAPHIQK